MTFNDDYDTLYDIIVDDLIEYSSQYDDDDFDFEYDDDMDYERYRDRNWDRLI